MVAPPHTTPGTTPAELVVDRSHMRREVPINRNASENTLVEMGAHTSGSAAAKLSVVICLAILIGNCKMEGAPPQGEAYLDGELDVV